MWKTPRTGEMNPTKMVPGGNPSLSHSFGRLEKQSAGGGVVVLSLKPLEWISCRGYVVVLFAQLLTLLVLFYVFFVHECGRRRNRVSSCFKIAGYGNSKPVPPPPPTLQMARS